MSPDNSFDQRETVQHGLAVITYKGDEPDAEREVAQRIVQTLLDYPDRYPTFAIQIPQGDFVGEASYGFFIHQLPREEASKLVIINASSSYPIPSENHAFLVQKLLIKLAESLTEQHPQEDLVVSFLLGSGHNLTPLRLGNLRSMPAATVKAHMGSIGRM